MGNRFFKFSLILCFLAACSTDGVEMDSDWPANKAKQQVLVKKPNQQTQIRKSKDKTEKKKTSKELSEKERLALIEKKADAKLTETKDVEIYWQVPNEDVLTYYLTYGYSRRKLDKSQMIPVRRIEQVSNPKYGVLFRYVIKDVDKSKAIYFRLQAENKIGRSRKSPVQKVNY